MKKILLALIVAPMAIAFEAGAEVAPMQNNTDTQVTASVPSDAQVMRRYPRRRVRRCNWYRNDCARIRTPIGTIGIGRCRRVCGRWGWGWAGLTNTENANTVFAAKTVDLANKYDMPVDMADAIVGNVEETKALPSNDVISKMAETYDVDANVVRSMLDEAAAQ